MTYKKELRKKAFFQSGTKDDRKKFHDCLKAIRELKKIKSKKVVSKTALHQEKNFNKNRWKFPKKVINGSLNTPEQQVGFSVDEANVYYPRTYSHLSTRPRLAHWIGSPTFQLTLLPVKTTPHLTLTPSAQKI